MYIDEVFPLQAPSLYQITSMTSAEGERIDFWDFYITSKTQNIASYLMYLTFISFYFSLLVVFVVVASMFWVHLPVGHLKPMSPIIPSLWAKAPWVPIWKSNTQKWNIIDMTFVHISNLDIITLST